MGLRAYLIVFLQLVVFASARAQTFTVAHDTVYVPAFTTAPAATPRNDIKNITTGNLTIKWHVVATDFPADWLTAAAFSICDNERCRTNLSNALWNTTTSTGQVYSPVYHANASRDSVGNLTLATDLTNTTSIGCHWVTINLADAGTGYSKNVTFVLCKVPAAVQATTSQADDVVIYPNPANEELNVVFDDNTDVKTIAIYSIIGKIMNVYKVVGTSANLNLENIPAGVYYVRLINASGEVVVTRKFTKQ